MPKQSRDILFVIGSLDLGGAERHLSLIAPRLKQLGWNPNIYCITRRGLQSYGVEREGVKVIGPPFEIDTDQSALGKFFKLLASCIKLFGILLFKRPRIVHFFLPVAYVMGAPLALLAGTPILIMSRRSLNIYQKQHPVLRRLERWLHPRMNAILGNSRAVIDQLIELEDCDRDKVNIIYNGIDIAGIDQAKAIENSSPSDSSDLVLIIVANLIPYKGHSDLIAALATVRRRLPERWTLLCVGRDDGIRVKLENQLLELNLIDHVRFLGQRTDVASLLKRADISILCSHQEGFSNAILEGMAAGLPIVATDVGGNAEAVVHGETGLIVAPYNPAALGAAILELASNPAERQKMGLAARRRIENHFSIDRCVKLYDEFYQTRLPTTSDVETSDEKRTVKRPQLVGILRLIGILAVSCITFAIALSIIDLKAAWSAVSSLPAATILGAGGLLLLGTVFATFRFKYMAFDIGHTLSLRDAMLALGIGQIAGVLTIQYFGQIAARSALLGPRGFSPPANIIIATYERFMAAAVSAILAVAGAWYLFGYIAFDFQKGADQFLKIMAGLLVAFVISAIFSWKQAALNAIQNRQGGTIFISVLRNLCLTFAIQACTMSSYILIALFLLPSFSISNIIAASAVITFTASLPISFAGWGVRELSAIFVLGIIGIQPDKAVAIAVLTGTLALLAVTLLSVAALAISAGKALPQSSKNIIDDQQIDVVTAVHCGIPLIAATAVYFQIHVPVQTTLLNLNLADPVVFFGGALFAFYYVIGRRPQWRLPGLNSHVLVITAVIVFAFFHGLLLFGWNDWAFNNRFLGWFILLCYAATGALIVKSSHDGLFLFTRAFVGSAVAVVLIEFTLLFVDSLIVRLPAGIVTLPIVGFSQNRNALAFILLLATCGTTMMQSQWRPLVLSILFAGLWYAGSRASFGAVTVVLLFAYFLRALTDREIRLGVVIGCGIVAIIPTLQIIATLQFVTEFIGYETPTQGVEDGGPLLWVFQLSPDSSDTERFTSISDGIRLFFSHPIFGAGLGAFVQQGIAHGKQIVVIHSTPVWLLAETGLIGFLAFTIPAIRLFFREWIRSDKDTAGRMLILIMVAFGIVSLVHEIMYQRAFWLLLGATLAYLPLNVQESSNQT